MLTGLYSVFPSSEFATSVSVIKLAPKIFPCVHASTKHTPTN